MVVGVGSESGSVFGFVLGLGLRSVLAEGLGTALGLEWVRWSLWSAQG